MNSSDKLDQIAPALVAALGKMKNPKKDSTANAGKYAYSYLSLPELTEYVRPALDKVGLVATQEVTDVEGSAGVLTRIWHLSGQWIEFGPCVIHSGSGAQERGSATSYARRYALAAAVGLAPEEDDDGAKASKSSDPTPSTSRGSDKAGPGEPKNLPPSSGSAPTVGEVAEGTGEGPDATSPATPEQRTRLLALYKRPSAIKEKAGELFGRPSTMAITDLTSAEIEALILEAAS